MFLLETISASHSSSSAPSVVALERASGERPREAAFSRTAASASALVAPEARTRLVCPVRSRVLASARKCKPAMVNLITPTSPTLILGRPNFEKLVAAGRLDAESFF